MIKIEIGGEPIPAARPRFSGRRAYQPKRNVEYRQRVQAAAKLAMFNAAPMTGELSAVVKLYRKYKRTARIFGDVDNHAYLVSRFAMIAKFAVVSSKSSRTRSDREQ